MLINKIKMRVLSGITGKCRDGNVFYMTCNCNISLVIPVGEPAFKGFVALTNQGTTARQERLPHLNIATRDAKRMEGVMSPKLWDILSSSKEKAYRVFTMRTDRARSPRTGEAYDFFVLESSDWVNVIPVTPDDRVVLIKQYRHGTREITVEIPGGLIEANDTPAVAASRELSEETGYHEEEIIPLGWVHPNPAILSNRCYTFVARNVVLEGSQALDEKEDIEVVLYPLNEIPVLIRSGAISHSLVIAAFYRFYMEYLPHH